MHSQQGELAVQETRSGATDTVVYWHLDEVYRRPDETPIQLHTTDIEGVYRRFAVPHATWVDTARPGVASSSGSATCITPTREPIKNQIQVVPKDHL